MRVRLNRRRSLCVLVALLCGLAASGGADESKVQKNPVDLTKDKFFARPLTELEAIVINLKAKAKEVASFFEGDNRLHLLKRGGMGPDADAGFDPESGRIALVLTLHVTEMADPWREVCDSTLGSFAGWFYFPSLNEDADLKLRLLGKYFGEAVMIDRESAKQAADIFLRSIVARVIFTVVDRPPSPKLTFLRSCTKDELTGKTTYWEYRYQ